MRILVVTIRSMTALLLTSADFVPRTPMFIKPPEPETGVLGRPRLAGPGPMGPLFQQLDGASCSGLDLGSGAFGRASGWNFVHWLASAKGSGGARMICIHMLVCVCVCSMIYMSACIDVHVCMYTCT